MTRGAFLKKYMLKFAIALALLGLIVYVLAHATGFLVGSLYTMPVRMISDRQITSAEAYLFRDERVLYADENGIVEDSDEDDFYGTEVDFDDADEDFDE